MNLPAQDSVHLAQCGLEGDDMAGGHKCLKGPTAGRIITAVNGGQRFPRSRCQRPIPGGGWSRVL